MSYHNLQGSARDRRKYFINCQRRSYTQFKLRLTFTHISSSRRSATNEIDRLQFTTFISSLSESQALLHRCRFVFVLVLLPFCTDSHLLSPVPRHHCSFCRFIFPLRSPLFTRINFNRELITLVVVVVIVVQPATHNKTNRHNFSSSELVAHF